MRITIDLTEEEIKILKKRGRKTLLKLKEQVEDIVRRSCINSKTTTTASAKCDDKLVELFSRQRRISRKKKKI